MISPTIEMTDRAKVRLTYPHLPEFELNMDFNPIIQKFQLTGNSCLMHWQAKPFGLRRWGIYDAGKDEYFTATWNSIHCLCIPRFLQINEEITKTVPTAVLLFTDTKVSTNSAYISLMPI